MVIDGGLFTVRLNCTEPVPNAFVAVIVKVATPCAAGVPVMTPVDVFRVSPAGNVPVVTAHVIGVLPEATTAWE